jgi:hypothetical protein
LATHRQFTVPSWSGHVARSSRRYGSGVHTYVLRLWLPDRPGALGLVASRIGAARGSVVGIEILEQGAGRAVDELVVALPEPDLLDLLVAEVGQVDDVAVEDICPAGTDRHDPGLFALTVAAQLVEAASTQVLLDGLASDVASEFDCEWGAVIALDPPTVLASMGEPPPANWLAAFVLGSSHLDEGAADVGPNDLAWARLGAPGRAGRALAVAAGRHGRPFRWRERRQLAMLARIAHGVLALRDDASPAGTAQRPPDAVPPAMPTAEAPAPPAA